MFFTFLLWLFLICTPLPSFCEMVIAVPDFQVSGCMPHLGGAVTEQVRGALSNRGPWTLLESSQMNRIASEHKLSMSGLTDEKKAVKAAKVLGAQYLILGSVNATGSVFTITARLADAATGVVHTGFQAVSHDGEEGLISASKFLADDIAMELGGPDVPDCKAESAVSEDNKFQLNKKSK